jgi:hypothetical protein
MNSRKGFEEAARVQAELKAVLAPALDAWADVPRRLGDDAVKALVEAFASLQGQPFVYYLEKDGWQRRPDVAVDTLKDRLLALIADLFDSGKLGLLAHCRYRRCGKFFVTTGKGRKAKFCPGHAAAELYQRARDEGQQSKYYDRKKAKGIALAKRLRKAGVFGKALLEQLKPFHVGKTILWREHLWDDGEE